MDDENFPVECHPKFVTKKKQFCGYCPEDKCLLECKICNPKFEKDCSCNC